MSALGLLQIGVQPTFTEAPEFKEDATFGEVVGANYQAGISGGRSNSEQYGLDNLFAENIAEYSRLYGKNLKDDFKKSPTSDIAFAAKDFSGLGYPVLSETEAIFDSETFDAFILQQRSQGIDVGSLKTTAEQQEEVKRRALEDARKASEVNSRSGTFTGFAGQVVSEIGVMAQDPLQAPFLFLGAGGATIPAGKGAIAAAKIIAGTASKEAAIGTVGEVVNIGATKDFQERFTGEDLTFGDITKRLALAASVSGSISAASSLVRVGFNKVTKKNNDVEYAKLADEADTIEKQDAYTVLSQNATLEDNIPIIGDTPTFKQKAEHYENIAIASRQFYNGEDINIPDSDYLFYPRTDINNLDPEYINNFLFELSDDDLVNIANIENLQSLQDYAFENNLTKPAAIEKAIPDLVQKGYFLEGITAKEVAKDLDFDTPIYNKNPEEIAFIKKNRAELASFGIDTTQTPKKIRQQLEDLSAAIQSDLEQNTNYDNPFKLPDDVLAQIDNTLNDFNVIDEIQTTLPETETGLPQELENTINSNIQRLLDENPNIQAALDEGDMSLKNIIKEIKENEKDLLYFSSCGV